jgi:hypothetical protein
MLLAIFGIGVMELLVVGVVAMLLVGVPIAVVVAILVLVRRGSLGTQFPPPAGPPIILHSFAPADVPISSGARWSGNDLEVTADMAGPQRLFELPVSRIDQSMISYCFRIQTDDLKSSVYPEMWCRVAGMAECFSRGLNQKVRGGNHGSSVMVPFYLRQGQFAELLKLNLVFEGPGTVRLSDIVVLATPLGSDTR